MDLLCRIRFNSSPTLAFCEAQWSWSSPTLRDFDLWCILQGQGELSLAGVTHPLRPGTCFLLPPGSRPQASHNPKNRLVVFALHFDLLDDEEMPMAHFPNIPEGTPIYVDDTERLRLLTECLAFSDHLNTQRSLTAGRLGFGQLILLLSEPRSGGQQGSEPRIRRVMKRINEEPSKTWPVSEMAQLAGLSESHFSRLFRQVARQSPRQHVIAARMARARVLLRESYASQAEIAEMLGFGDVYFFNRQFTQCHEVSPGRFRRQ